MREGERSAWLLSVLPPEPSPSGQESHVALHSLRGPGGVPESPFLLSVWGAGSTTAQPKALQTVAIQ